MPTPDNDLPTTETNMLDQVLALEDRYYKPGPGYEFNNGRKFEEGLGPYAP